MTNACCDRRRFLRTSAVGAAGVGGVALLSSCGSGGSGEAPAPNPGAPWNEVLSASELPVGESAEVAIGEDRILLHRSAETEVHAFSAVCTHQGCAVAPEPERFACPCHGSVFNLETGAPEGGPAREPLPSYPAEINGEMIRVRA